MLLRRWTIVTMFALLPSGCGDSPSETPQPLPPPPQVQTQRPVADVVQAEWVRIQKWLYRVDLDMNFTFNVPAKPEYLAEVEERLAVQFPADFRASLELHNGQRDTSRGFFFSSYPLLPLVKIEEIQKTAAAAENAEAVAAEIRRKTPAEFHGQLKADADIARRWIRFAGDQRDFLALDLDPGPDGHLGQVVNAGANVETVRVIAPSYLALLHAWADILDGDQCEVRDVDGQKKLFPLGQKTPIAALAEAAASARQ